jgi:flagellar assembly protein FliH
MAQPSVTLPTFRPVASVTITTDPKTLVGKAKPAVDPEALKPDKEKLARAGEGLSRAAAALQQIQEELFGSHRDPIVRLSIGIAEKILMRQIEAGQYDIARIIGEALAIAPPQEPITVRMNPQDLEVYDKTLQDLGKCRPGNITFKSDGDVGRAECVVETSKGLIESRIAEHLRLVEEALLQDKPQ